MKKIFTLLLVLSSLFSFSQSTTLVISQAYGGGGNTGATYNADYVELKNISGAAQSLSGFSIQYSSATNIGTWSGVFALPAVSIPAGGYYLIQMSAAGATGSALPTPDVVIPTAVAINMSGSNGRVALVNNTTALSACPTAGVIDLVGYGTSVCFEGAGACPALTSTTAATRGNNGCAETNNNLVDITAVLPAPRNSATSVAPCGAVAASLTATPNTIASFGSITVGANSTSQSFNLTGANLTGATANITITAPSANFQVSNDNTSWNSSTTIQYTSATLASTPVYVRFTPQSAGPQSGNLTITGGGVASAVTVAVSGTGAAVSVATLLATPLTAFGNNCVNVPVGPFSFTISGSNLSTANLEVAPLSGFTYSTTAGGTYTTSLSLVQGGGTQTQPVYVKFTPTAIQSYSGNIVVSGGGAAAINVAAVGAGANNPPALTTNAASGVTAIAATIAGAITSTGCTAVTGYGFEYSTVNGFANGSGTSVSSSNLSGGSFSSNLTGLTPATTYYYKANAVNGGGTGYGTQQSFTTPTPVLTATTIPGFGSLCVNTTSAAGSFIVSSTVLTAANVTVAALSGYTYSTTLNGTYSPTLTITQPGGPFSQEIFVKFTPTLAQAYNGNIAVSGGGAPARNIAVSGMGINTPPTVKTDTVLLLTPYSVRAFGTITDLGCSAISESGIEYSSYRMFANGSGTKISAANLNAGTGVFSSDITDLIQSTTYYYKAYAVNDGGIAYGPIDTFTTQKLKAGLIIYSNPIAKAGIMHYTLSGIPAGHYSVQIYNSIGQLVFNKEIVTNFDFVDEYITLPGTLRTGRYSLQIASPYKRFKKMFMIR